MKPSAKEITIRSSAAEYLTFIASSGDNWQGLEERVKSLKEENE